jgi:hypothetical protein
VAGHKIECTNSLLRGGELGHSLGAFRHGVLGKLTREQQTHGGLDFAAGDGVALVVASQAAGLHGDALKDVVHERVHDAHGLGGDTSVRVDLLEDLVHVGAVCLLAGALAALLSALSYGLLAGGLLACCHLDGSEKYASEIRAQPT